MVGKNKCFRRNVIIKIKPYKAFYIKFDKLIKFDKETQHVANMKGMLANGVVL